MTHDEQVAALKTRLDDVNNSINQLNTALAASTDFDQRESIQAQIAQLQQTADTLRTMLNNLSASGVAAPLAMAAAPAKRAVEVHNKAMVKSARSSADQGNKRALATVKLIKVPATRRPKQPKKKTSER